MLCNGVSNDFVVFISSCYRTLHASLKAITDTVNRRCNIFHLRKGFISLVTEMLSDAGMWWNILSCKQTVTASRSAPLFITNRGSNSHEGQLTPPLFIFLWLKNPLFFFLFLSTRCWLIVQEDSFPPGEAGSAAVPSPRVWKWRWQDVDEEAPSVTSNRRALECSTLPAGNEPSEAALCSPVTQSPSHSLPSTVSPQTDNSYTHTQLSIKH